jgi:hypothetical protein
LSIVTIHSLHNRRGFFSDYWLGSVSGRRDSAAPRLTTAQFERLLHRVDQLVERVNGAEAPDLTQFRERFAHPLLEDVFGFRLGTEQPEPRFRLLTDSESATHPGLPGLWLHGFLVWDNEK